MRMHWWQSIRWRLALGSVAVVILATAVMAASAILAIAYYYSSEQQHSLTESAQGTAQSLSENYAKDGTFTSAISGTFPTRSTSRAMANSGTVRDSHGDNYLFLVFNDHNRLVFPTAGQLAAHNPAIWTALLKALRRNALSGENATTGSMRTAVLQAQNGSTISGEIGPRYLGLFPRPFIAMPIRSGTEANASVVGVLLMTPVTAANNTLPDFVNEAGQVVLRTSLIVAILAALAAILFARTITRPLAKVTEATRVLSSGDYSARVLTRAPGELGELAHNFNDMAVQLQRDVEELRKQELWRRELIMSITHDLATPLTAIAGLGDALVDGVNQSREDYEETGRVIVRETLRLRRLVKDLHMMAKVEAGALEPQRKPTRLAPLVDEVLAVLVTEFERAGVEPRNMISYSLPTADADPDMLTRVVSNLCDNALQHTPPGGSVTIEALPQANMLAVSVTDTGKGIPPEALERVFERFFRADTARQSLTGGSGLGLAIVRAIVEAHGGRIWAENVAGAGARFTFTLPLTQQQAPSVSEEPTLRLPRKFRTPGEHDVPSIRSDGTPIS
ncbi:MAG TPA: HAMP domain-containing sensor histidine kinase [Ktedonobacteraceae bacterium]|nr:HAMP domain-containing sensor histidine kinase [Ktedonobacteraceae bacterium]